MAALQCLSAPPTILVGLKPLPNKFNSSSSSSSSTKFNQISFRNSLSPPFGFKPLRWSLTSNRRFSTMASMSSSADNTNEPLWNSLGKSIENLGKKPSVEDLLRQQIEKQEYYNDDGGGGDRPGGRGGRGGGGGGDGFGGSEEEGFAGILDETIQVVLATLGFIFMYAYIINGAEMTRLANDYIKYLFGGRKSNRLARALYKWERFCKKRKEKKEVDKFWLEKAIINTSTWWDSPDKYKRLLKALSPVRSRSDANEELSDEYGSQASGEMSDEYY